MFDYREAAAPYPGLRPFEPFESEIFFGREGHTDRLLEILQREHFLAVIGPSGCGKSSLVRAGLLPGLASGVLGTGSDWRLALLRPGGQPLLALAQALLGRYALGPELVGEERIPQDAEDIGPDAALIAAELRRGPAGLRGLLQTAAARRRDPGQPCNLLVLVDQFEELFTYADTQERTDGEAEAFVELLLESRGELKEAPALFSGTLSRRALLLPEGEGWDEGIKRPRLFNPPHPSPLPEGEGAESAIHHGQQAGASSEEKEENKKPTCRIYIALTLRTDFLGHCVRFLNLPDAINRAQYLTPRLSKDEMARAIAGPARVFGGRVDEALVGALIKQAGQDSDQLPILQHALARMWRVAESESSRGLYPPLPPGEGRGEGELINHHSAPRPLLVGKAAEQAVGGIEQALNRHADAVLADLPEEQQALAQTLFRAITERRDGGQDVRRPQRLGDIAQWAGVALDALIPIVQAFAAPEVSFLHYGRELTGNSVIDLTHEALIRQWDRLQGWLAEEYQRGQNYRRWSARALEYRDGRGSLLSGGDLARALEWWNPAADEAGEREPRWQPTPQWASRYHALDGAVEANGARRARAAFPRGAWERGPIPSFRQGMPTAAAAEPKSRDRDVTGLGCAPSMAMDPGIPCRGDDVSILFELTRQFLSDSRDAERQAREAEQRRLQAEAETERRLAEAARAGESRARRWTRVAVLVAAVAVGLAGAALWFKAQAQQAEQQRSASLFESQLTHGSLLARVEDYAEARRVLAASRRLDGDVDIARRHARNLLAGYVDSMGGQAEQVYAGAGAALSGGVAVSPDGKLLAAAGERSTLVLFDAASGRLLRRLEGPSPMKDILARIWSVVFDPQGRWLFSGGEDGRVLRWSLPAGGKLGEWKLDTAVKALALSPDGATLAVGGDDGRIHLWSAADGKPLRTLEGHSASIAAPNGLAFSPDGERLASASFDKTARIWDWRKGKPLFSLPGHTDGVKAVAFSPDGKYLATASADKQVILWDTASGQPIRPLRGHQNIVFGLAFSADGGQLLSASRDNTLRLWDVASGVTRRVYQGHQAGLWAVTRHGDRFYSAANDATLRRWSLVTPEQWLWQTDGSPISTAIAPDGRWAAVGMKDGALRLYGLPDGQLLSEIPQAHGNTIGRVAFSPDGGLLATASDDNTAKLWRLETVEGKPRLQPLHSLEGHSDTVHAVAFSPDGRRLASAGYDGQIGLFEVASGQGRMFSAHEGHVDSVVFNTAGNRLLSAGNEDRRLRLWDVNDPSRPPQDIAQAGDNLLWASLSPDGRQLAAVGREQTVSLYDLAQPAAAPHRLVGHEQTVFRASYSPDGRQLATVGGDMTVRLWDVDSQRQLFALRLPTDANHGVPLWDFDFRCTAQGECWIAVPLTVGRLALYRLPYE